MSNRKTIRLYTGFWNQDTRFLEGNGDLLSLLSLTCAYSFSAVCYAKQPLQLTLKVPAQLVQFSLKTSPAVSAAQLYKIKISIYM